MNITYWIILGLLIVVVFVLLGVLVRIKKVLNQLRDNDKRRQDILNRYNASQRYSGNNPYYEMIERHKRNDKYKN